MELDTVECAALSSFNLEAFDSIQASISGSILGLVGGSPDFSARAEIRKKFIMNWDNIDTN